VVERATRSPAGDEANPPLTAIEADVAEEESVTATPATTPSAIWLASRPVRTQWYAVAGPAQFTDFPAATPDGPAVTLTALTLAAV
jgi:hypothetical protein